MKPDPESRAWTQLHDHAAARLRPGFAHAVLRAARGAHTAEDRALLRHFSLSAAAVTACLLVGVFAHTRSVEAESVRNAADWHQLADADDETDDDADDLNA